MNRAHTEIFHLYHITILQLRTRNRDALVIDHGRAIALGNPQPVDGEFGLRGHAGVEVCGAALDVDFGFLGQAADGLAARLDPEGDGFGGHSLCRSRA